MTIVKHNLSIVQEYNDRIIFSIRPNEDESIGLDFDIILSYYPRIISSNVMDGRQSNQIMKLYNFITYAMMDGLVDLLNNTDNICKEKDTVVDNEIRRSLYSQKILGGYPRLRSYSFTSMSGDNYDYNRYSNIINIFTKIFI